MTKMTTPASAPTTTKPRDRVKWTAAERAEWLELYKQSGQSVSEFCRANDLPPATLSLWRRQQVGASEPALKGRLVEISVAALNTPPPAAAAGVSLQLRNGATLQIVPGTDPVWLGSLVSALVSAGA
jgi:transposase-like protein